MRCRILCTEPEDAFLELCRGLLRSEYGGGRQYED